MIYILFLMIHLLFLIVYILIFIIAKHMINYLSSIPSSDHYFLLFHQKNHENYSIFTHLFRTLSLHYQNIANA